MTVIQLYCTDVNDKRRIVRQEHDTPLGRSLIDKAAFAEMARPEIVSCATERTETTERAIPRGNGRYR